MIDAPATGACLRVNDVKQRFAESLKCGFDQKDKWPGFPGHL
ncbi:MAG: hypothetical protein NZM00_08730 [Anaerolinea sp.]|nr:hypothetical protein [Anaerolinea sp.]